MAINHNDVFRESPAGLTAPPTLYNTFLYFLVFYIKPEDEELRAFMGQGLSAATQGLRLIVSQCLKATGTWQERVSWWKKRCGCVVHSKWSVLFCAHDSRALETLAAQRASSWSGAFIQNFIQYEQIQNHIVQHISKHCPAALKAAFAKL